MFHDYQQTQSSLDVTTMYVFVNSVIFATCLVIKFDFRHKLLLHTL